MVSVKRRPPKKTVKAPKRSAPRIVKGKSGASYGTTQGPKGRAAQQKFRTRTQKAAKILGVDFGKPGQHAKSFSLLPEAEAYQAPAKVVYQVVTKGGKALVNKHGQTIRRGYVKKTTTTTEQSKVARGPTTVLDNQKFWKQQKKIKIKGYPRTTVGGKPKYDQQYGVTGGSFDTVELSNLADVTRGQQGDVLGRLMKKGKVTKTGYQTRTKGHFEYPDNTGFNPFKKYIAPKDVNVKTSKPLVVGKSPEIKVKKGPSPKQSKNRKITEFGVVGGAAGGVGLWDQFTSFFNQPLIPEAHAAVGTSGIVKQITKLTKEVDAVKDGKKMFISDEKRDNYVKSRVEKIVKLEQKLGERSDEVHGGNPIPLPGLAPSGKQIINLADAPKPSIIDDVILPGGNVIKTVDINPALDKGFSKLGGAIKKPKLTKKQKQAIAASGAGFGTAGVMYPWLQAQGATSWQTGVEQQIKTDKGKTIPPATTLTPETTKKTIPGQRDLLAEQTAMSASLLPTASGFSSPQPTIKYGLPDEYGVANPAYQMVQGSRLEGGKVVLFDQWVKIGMTSGVQKQALEDMYARQAKGKSLNVLKAELNKKMAKAGGNIEMKAKIAQTFYRQHPELGRLPAQYNVIISAYGKQGQVNPAIAAIAWQKGGPYTQGTVRDDGTYPITIRPSGYAGDTKHQQQALSDKYGITTFNADGSVATTPKKS